MKVLILGATGLVRRNTLAEALAQPAVTQVIAPTRKPLTKQENGRHEETRTPDLYRVKVAL